MRCIGLDICPTGWIGVEIADDVITVHYFPTVRDLTKLGRFDVIGIDIPIGLPTSGYRDCDIAGKALLGTRSSTLFHVPVREALSADSPEEASRISRQIMGAGVSRQSYGLREKIFEVESWLQESNLHAYEIHPELSFRECLGYLLRPSKKTWLGVVERRQALLREGIDLDVVTPEVGIRAKADDMLDAGIVAWSARRIAQGSAQFVGDEFKIWF